MARRSLNIHNPEQHLSYARGSSLLTEKDKRPRKPKMQVLRTPEEIAAMTSVPASSTEPDMRGSDDEVVQGKIGVQSRAARRERGSIPANEARLVAQENKKFKGTDLRKEPSRGRSSRGERVNIERRRARKLTAAEEKDASVPDLPAVEYVAPSAIDQDVLSPVEALRAEITQSFTPSAPESASVQEEVIPADAEEPIEAQVPDVALPEDSSELEPLEIEAPETAARGSGKGGKRLEFVQGSATGTRRAGIEYARDTVARQPVRKGRKAAKSQIAVRTEKKRAEKDRRSRIARWFLDTANSLFGG